MAVMTRLRAPGGCPWDREQTYESLAPYLLEETYEAFDAIQDAKDGNTDNLREELGDVLLQIVFHSVIAAELGDFTVDDVVKEVSQKLVLRHPHVFGSMQLHTAQDVLTSWDELKANQRRVSGQAEKVKDSILDTVSLNFPALLEAQKLTSKASRAGFDWKTADQVKEKIAEEFAELEAAVEEKSREKIQEEMGDLLFAVLNLSRKLKVDAETALKQTNRKFRKRFAFIERELKARGKTLDDANLDEMDALWNRAKIEQKSAENNSGEKINF